MEMRGLILTLTEADYQFLTNYFLTADLSGFNQRILIRELIQPRIVKPDCLPLNVVCANTRVLVWNMSKNQMFTVHIVSEDVGGRENKISIKDPVAIALLGYPAGAITEWEIDGEINVLKVISVTQLDSQGALPV